MIGRLCLRTIAAIALCCVCFAARAGVPTTLPYGFSAFGNVTEGTSSSPVTITDWGNLDLSGTLNLTGPANISGLLGLQVMPLLHNIRLMPTTSAAECNVTPGNSAATNTANLPTCLASMPTLGGVLQFGAGTYQFASPIVVSSQVVCFMGAAEFATTIRGQYTGGAHIFSQTYAGNGGCVANMNLTQNAISPSPTAGCAVDFENGSNMQAYNLIIKQSFNAVCLVNTGYVYLYNINASNPYNDCYYINGVNYLIAYGDTCLHSGSAQPVPRAAWEFVSAAGARVSLGTGQTSDGNILIDPCAPNSVGTVDFVSNNYDNNQAIGIDLDTTCGGGANGSPGQIFQVHLEGSGSPFGIEGVSINGGCAAGTFWNGTYSGTSPPAPNTSTYAGLPTITHVSLNNMNINRNQQRGVYLQGCWDWVQLSNGQLMGNSASSAAVPGSPPSTIYPAIEVESAGAAPGYGHFMMANETVGQYLNPFYTGDPGDCVGTPPSQICGTWPGAPPWGPNYQSGIYFGPNYNGSAVLDGVMAAGNYGFDFDDVGTGPPTRIIGDVGVVANGSRLPCEMGSASIPVGSSSVAVTYKTGANSANPLSASPTRISLAASAPVAIGAGTPGTASMTLSTAASVTGAALTIWWLAGVDGKSSCFN
jgi:hypothetical protein